MVKRLNPTLVTFLLLFGIENMLHNGIIIIIYIY
jgi:hypothetical protein